MVKTACLLGDGACDEQQIAVLIVLEHPARGKVKAVYAAVLGYVDIHDGRRKHLVPRGVVHGSVVPEGKLHVGEDVPACGVELLHRVGSLSARSCAGEYEVPVDIE